MRYYVVGDTGGHLNLLIEGLREAGVDPENYVIPEDMTVIHLGDLIHKGPSSSLKSLGVVRRMQKANPGRWVQLVGNHEMQHIQGGIPFWRCDCGEEFEELLAEMFSSGDVRASYAVKGLQPANLSLSARTTFVPQNKDWLFTHGGLTHLWWGLQHSYDSDAETLSEAINALPVVKMTSPGTRLGYPRNPASPVWASAPDEVFPGWYDEGSMPFNQVFGHTYLYDWERGRWFGRPAKNLRKSTKLNEETRMSLTMIGDALLVGTDPGFEKSAPSIKRQPVTFIGETS